MGYTLLPDSLSPAAPSGGYTLLPEQQQPGWTESLLPAAGYGLDTAAAGLRAIVPDKVRSFLDWANNKLGMGEVPSIDPKMRADLADTMKNIEQAHPITSALLENWPQLATTNPVAAGLMAALNYGTPQERALRGVTAGVGTAAANVAAPYVAKGTSALGDWIGNIISKPQAANAEIGAAENIAPLSLGQRTNNDLVKRLEFWLAKFPGSKGWYENLGEEQQNAVNGAINSLTMNRGGGAALQAAGEGKNWVKDPDFISAMQTLPDSFRTLPAEMQPTKALNIASKWAGGPDLQMSPAVAARNPGINLGGSEGGLPSSMPIVGPKDTYNNYQAIRSMLGKMARSQAEASPEQAGYKGLQSALDDAAERSMIAQGANPQDIAAARQAYRMQKLFGPAEEQQASGAVTYSAPKAANAIDRAIRNGDTSGLPPETMEKLRQLMAFGRSVRPVSTSGTAENQLTRLVATLGFLGGMGGAEAGFGEHIGHAPAILAGMVAAPWAVNRALQSSAGGVGFPALGRMVAKSAPTLGDMMMRLAGPASTAATQ
jgi:hypothetical protein